MDRFSTIPLFHGLRPDQLDRLKKSGEKVSLGAGEYLIREGDDSLDVFIITKGQVEIVKGAEEHRVASLGPGEIVGEIALLEKGRRSASVKTLEPTEALALRSQRLVESDELRDVQSQLFRNIAVELCERVRDQNVVTVRTLEARLAENHARLAMAMFLVNFIMLASLYTLTLGALLGMSHLFGGTTPITLVLLVVFVGVLTRFAVKSGYPLSSYGLTWSGWQRSLREALLLSAGGAVLVVLLKAGFVATIPSLAHRSVFDVHGSITDYGAAFSWKTWFGYVGLYALFCPVQELIARGFIQSALQRFLAGPFEAPNARQSFTANLIANLAFVAVHSHISLGFAFLTFVPGLAWGWLYRRHGTLVGVSVSHILLGVLAGFVLNLHF
ncbi:MAG: cyclic nucleotide-binding domain-containing protein [Polyangiaceae bacterium]